MTGTIIIPMTMEMVTDVAILHLEAFAGHLSTRIGMLYIERFMRWFCVGDQTIALVAMDSHSRILGYVVGAPVGYNTSINKDLLWVAIMGILRHPWLFLNSRFLQIIKARLGFILCRSPKSHMEPRLPEPTMSLVAIGVSPSATGKGVGQQLIQAFESKARELMMQSLRLSVYRHNARARGLYEKSGWQPFSEPQAYDKTMYYFQIIEP